MTDTRPPDVDALARRLPRPAPSADRALAMRRALLEAADASPPDRLSSRCAHCSAALLVKACPRCLSRVFHGHKHCPECGSELGIAAAAHTHADRACPRCTTALHARCADDVVIDERGACLGVFLDHVAIKRIVVDRAQSRAEALLGTLPRVEVNPLPAAGQKMAHSTEKILAELRALSRGEGMTVVDTAR